MKKEKIPESILTLMEACPDYIDFPTAWAIQKERGESLQHDSKCSSVPDWDPMSGPHFLCDCGAVEKEYDRLKNDIFVIPA